MGKYVVRNIKFKKIDVKPNWKSFFKKDFSFLVIWEAKRFFNRKIEKIKSDVKHIMRKNGINVE